MATGGEIQTGNLLKHFRELALACLHDAKNPIPKSNQAPATVRPLAEQERDAIFEALNATKGNKLMAAELLGIGKTTLYRKLKEYESADARRPN